MKQTFSQEELLWGAWFAVGISFPRSASDAFDALDSIPNDALVGSKKVLDSLVPQLGIAIEKHNFHAIFLGGFLLTRRSSLMRLSGDQYDVAREFAHSLNNPNFQTNSPLWPASKLTLINRLGHGSWLGVERSIGLVGAGDWSGGEESSHLKCEMAMVSFWYFCQIFGIGPYSENYKKWRRIDKEARPTLAQIHQVSTSWATALSLAYSNYISGHFVPKLPNSDDVQLGEALRGEEWDEWEYDIE